ncbi:MAG: AAA family ATPase [Polyangiaceae bacterium]|nr:AAA family ATPase [Polyangiaceae bacterium]
MAALSPVQIALMQEVLAVVTASPPAPPSVPEFRVKHANERTAIDELISRRALQAVREHYLPTLAGLRAAATDEARATIRRCNALVESLKERVRSDPRKTEWTAEELSRNSEFSTDEVAVLLTILVTSGEPKLSAGHAFKGHAPFVTQVRVSLDGVLDAQPFAEVEPSEPLVGSGPGTVSRLYVHNFRSFVNFEWKPPAACVLVGENGAGKTALLEVLWLLQELLVSGLAVDATGALSARTVWLDDPEQTIELDIDRGEESFRYRLVIRWDGEQPSIREELRGSGVRLYQADAGLVELFGDSPPPLRTTIPFDRRRSFIASLEPRPDNRRVTAFRELVASIWAIKPDANRILGTANEESNHLKRDLSNFASWYLARVAEDPDALAALVQDLRRALAGFASLRFERISPKSRALLVRFSFGETSYELGWAELSDGQRLLIALYGMLRFGLPRASLIAIDEVENYVSPSEIQPWLRAVADAAADHRQQLLLVSHHPESINYLAADSAWRMWRDPDAGHTRIDRLQPDLDAGVTAYDALKLELTPDEGAR